MLYGGAQGVIWGCSGLLYGVVQGCYMEVFRGVKIPSPTQAFSSERERESLNTSGVAHPSGNTEIVPLSLGAKDSPFCGTWHSGGGAT